MIDLKNKIMTFEDDEIKVTQTLYLDQVSQYTTTIQGVVYVFTHARAKRNLPKSCVASTNF